jgi:hypothetical protein
MYRLGILPSGAPLRAVVSGDVPLAGSAAACQTCHQRSGMGTVEGKSWTPPIAGRILFAARGSGVRLRPPYDDETLARALRTGLDAAGRPFDPLMPRYDLSRSELADLTGYLRGLSATTSPGVTDSEIRFATVVTPDADPAVKKSMLGVLEMFLATRNVQTRHLGKWDQYARNFRKWTLETWSLTGPPATWSDQLEEMYGKKPVFALLSGAGGAEWTPVHDFCERHGIPCILPNVDVPPAGAGAGYYSLYYTRGVALEAETIAAEIADAPKGTRVVQFHPAEGPGRAGADALRKILSARGGLEIVDVVVGAEPSQASIASSRARQIAVLWLPAEAATPALAARPPGEKWNRVFVSSTLLGGEPPPATFSLRPGVSTDLVHPFSPPSEIARRWPRVSTWLKTRGVPPGDRRTQDLTLAACQVTGDALMHVNDEFKRDYFLELVDHVGGIAAVSAFQSRLSSGPGQRVLSRGAYIVPIDKKDKKEDAARWVVP